MTLTQVRIVLVPKAGTAVRRGVVASRGDVGTGSSVGAVGSLVAVSLLALAAGCGDGTGSQTGGAGAVDGPTIIATTSIWADVVSNVSCDGQANVELLIPIGGDPHTAEPSLADRERMENAALVVANGLLLEEGLEDTIASVEAAGTPVFWMGDYIETIDMAEGADHAHEDHAEKDGPAGHAHEGADPHVWFDPVRVSNALPALAEQLVADDGLSAAAVDTCLAAYQEPLAAADRDVASLIEALPPTVESSSPATTRWATSPTAITST